MTKSTRPLNNPLRVLIAGGSVAAFIGGWALIAHAPIASEVNAAPELDAPALDQNAPAQNIQPAPNSVPGQLQALPTPRSRSNLPQLQPNTQPFGQFSQPQFGQRPRRLRSGGS